MTVSNAQRHIFNPLSVRHLKFRLSGSKDSKKGEILSPPIRQYLYDGSGAYFIRSTRPTRRFMTHYLKVGINVMEGRRVSREAK